MDWNEMTIEEFKTFPRGTIFDILMRNDLTARTLTEIAKFKDDDIQLSLVRNPNTPTEVLTKLSTHYIWMIRQYVAEHPNTAPIELMKLSNDEQYDVRKAAKEALAKRKGLFNMFKLVELSIGYFAIVKLDVETDTMPINVHGFIQVGRIWNRLGYEAILLKGMSEELNESGEIESLKKEALEKTEESVAVYPHW